MSDSRNGWQGAHEPQCFREWAHDLAITKTLAKPGAVSAFRVLVLAGLLTAHLSSAAFSLSCAGEGTEVFPLPGEIPPNAVFAVQGKGVAGDFVRALTAEHIEFRSQKWSSTARILVRTEGYASRIEFVSSEPLPEGQVNISFLREISRQGELLWNRAGSWTVQGPPDESYPVILQQENEALVKVSDSGHWGKSIFAHFSVTSDDPAAYWLASVERAPEDGATSEVFTILLSAKSPSLGFGPCGGSYIFEPGKQYMVDLTPIDASGHRGRATAPSILVEVPPSSTPFVVLQE